MTVNRHIERFHGLPVFEFSAAPDGDAPAALPAADAVAWRIAVEYDSPTGFQETLGAFLDAVDTDRVRALVIGAWWADGYEPLTAALAAVTGAAGRLPGLRALFVGDVTYDECEISWLEMCDVTGALTAFPALHELVVRGGSGLVLRPVRHEALRALRLEAGGLPAEVVRAVGAGDFPALERLELWLGVDEYGGDHSVEDLAPFLTGVRFPALRHLGLENSEYQDEIAAAVAHAPVVARLDHLSLAMGVLTDEGAGALLEGQPLTHLTSLDLHHHYLTEPMQQRLTEALAGVKVDLSDAEDEEDEEDRYVAVAE
ncbi:STM4015 family protein [Kitasatospora sp. MBT63]|uniref:STM4015 family protein n=1 Tax=Kitasatospora sp. MBT63 TaxID=1444768 RepID=UPI00053AC523|nr:STM4015 family protein [Kitasatospora sp. MBT63]